MRPYDPAVRLRDIDVHEHGVSGDSDAERSRNRSRQQCQAEPDSVRCRMVWQRRFVWTVPQPGGLAEMHEIHLCWRHAHEWGNHPAHKAVAS